MIYDPQEDSYLLQSLIKRYAKDKSVLDIGSGSGIQAKEALKWKAKSLTVSDIDEESLAHLKKIENLTVIKSDLFENIEDSFDLIIFNPPYLPEHEKEDLESRKITTGGKKGDEIIIRFIDQVKPHMAPKCVVLLLTSSLTPKSKIKTKLKKLSLKFKPIAQKNLFMETLEVWEIQA